MENQTLAVTLNYPDFTTAGRLAEAVNSSLGAGRARAEDAATVRVTVQQGEDLVGLISTLERLHVIPDRVAKVVMNERTGTIIMGSGVRISTVAIAHGNLSVQIKTEYQVSQPRAGGQGKTAVIPDTGISVQEGKQKLLVMNEGPASGTWSRP